LSGRGPCGSVSAVSGSVDMEILRRWIQSVATALSNGYLLFPQTKMIYQGRLKSFCVPGLNCYSCPAATGACPLGALQNFFAYLRAGWREGILLPGLYVIGFLGLLGGFVGRMPCAWLCPFGFFQELLHKIPSPKKEIPRFFTSVKYGFLLLFIFLFPLLFVDEFGYGVTWFCKFVCPAGTLEAGLPLMVLQPELRELAGVLFAHKVSILVLIVAAAVLYRRPFCRVICPLGAFYSLFNRVSLFRMAYHPDRCLHCEACARNCPMGVKPYEAVNQTDCIRCLRCVYESCPQGALSWGRMALSERKMPLKKGVHEVFHMTDGKEMEPLPGQDLPRDVPGEKDPGKPHLG